MPPSKWDDEEESTSPPPPVIPRRSKFDDEEEEEVLDSWDAAEDSDVEREKEAKAAEAKAKAEAEAAANKKSKTQRINERKETRRIQAEEEESDESDEDEAEKRARLRRTEKESDLAHAADLFGEDGGVDEKPAPAKAPAKGKAKGGGDHDAIENVDMDRMKNRSAAPKTVVVSDSADPTNAVDLSAMALFKPTTKDQFTKLTTTLAPLLSAHSKKPHYASWAQEFTKQLVKELPSGEIKKIASALTTTSNEKMREERAADKGTKKSKAAKTKVSLAASRDDRFDSANYGGDDDGLGDDDFM